MLTRRKRNVLTKSDACEKMSKLFKPLLKKLYLNMSIINALPYVKGVTERISKVQRNNGVKGGFKPLNTLRTRFLRPKDKLTTFQSRCVVYRVNCLDCSFTYYGQTDRALATRIKEHQTAVRVCDTNSKIALHANKFGHDMDFNHAAVVDKSGDYHKRLFLEAWHSQRDQNAGNEHIDIPDVYKSLT